jgi:hypothetical protein
MELGFCQLDRLLLTLEVLFQGELGKVAEPLN